MRVSKIQFLTSVAVFLLVTLSPRQGALAQSDADSKTQVSPEPLTKDQLAIYRVVLHRWRDNDKFPIHLAIETIPLEADRANDDRNCDKTLDLEDIRPGEAHRFRESDLPKIGSSKIGLVDGEAQEKEVSENDPGKHLEDPKSIDKAVENGFAHGLVSLGEIRFDRKHEHAIVWYGFRCGMLCGNGGTLVLEKKNGIWKVRSQCSVWMSDATRETQGAEVRLAA